MSIRTLTDRLLSEAAEGRRRGRTSVEPPLVETTAPEPDLPEDIASSVPLRTIAREPKKETFEIPCGIAERFALRKHVAIQEAFLIAEARPEEDDAEEPEAPEEVVEEDADKAPITIELQSH